MTLEGTDVSADGSTIVGRGINAEGRREGWIARIDPIPEPGTFAMATAAAALLSAIGFVRRRRRSGAW